MHVAPQSLSASSHPTFHNKRLRFLERLRCVTTRALDRDRLFTLRGWFPRLQMPAIRALPRYVRTPWPLCHVTPNICLLDPASHFELAHQDDVAVRPKVRLLAKARLERRHDGIVSEKVALGELRKEKRCSRRLKTGC